MGPPGPECEAGWPEGHSIGCQDGVVPGTPASLALSFMKNAWSKEKWLALCIPTGTYRSPGMGAVKGPPRQPSSHPHWSPESVPWSLMLHPEGLNGAGEAGIFYDQT